MTIEYKLILVIKKKYKLIFVPQKDCDDITNKLCKNSENEL